MWKNGCQAQESRAEEQNSKKKFKGYAEVPVVFLHFPKCEEGIFDASDNNV